MAHYADFCGTCGTRFELDGRFCGTCGAPRSAVEAPPPNRSLSADPVHTPPNPTEPAPQPAPHPPPLTRPAAAPKLELTFRDGTVIPAAARVLIGRDPTPQQPGDLTIATGADRAVSKTHLGIERDTADLLWLADLHSTNGVTLTRSGSADRLLDPGERVVLQAGDQIGFGDQRLLVAAADRPSGPANPPAHQIAAYPSGGETLMMPGWGGLDAAPAAAGARPDTEPEVAEAAEHTPTGPGQISSAEPWAESASQDPQAERDPEPLAPAAQPPSARLSRVGALGVAVAALGAIGLLIMVTKVSTWGLSAADLLSWPEVSLLLASGAIALVWGLPPRAGQLGSAVAVTAAACLASAQLVSLTTSSLMPGWVAAVAVLAALSCLTLLGLWVASPEARLTPNAAPAHAMLLVTTAAGAAAFLAALTAQQRGFAVILSLAVAGLGGWGLWSARGSRPSWALADAGGLAAAAAVGHWTDTLTSSVRALCLVTALVLVASPTLTGGVGPARGSRAEVTPALGTSPGTGPIAVAWADLKAWMRSAWPGMVAAGGLYWLTVIVVLALVLAPLAGLAALMSGNASSDWSSDTSGSSEAAALVGALLLFGGVQVAATFLGQALGLLSSQALSSAAAEHTGCDRARGTTLAVRALRTFGSQLSTVMLYALGVFAGTMLCIIPGIYLQVRWAFALPAATRQGVRGADGLRASWALTENRGGVTFGTQLLGGLAILGASVVGGLAAWVTQLLFGTPLLGGVVWLVAVAFGVTCSAVLLGSLFRQFSPEDPEQAWAAAPASHGLTASPDTTAAGAHPSAPRTEWTRPATIALTVLLVGCLLGVVVYRARDHSAAGTNPGQVTAGDQIPTTDSPTAVATDPAVVTVGTDSHTYTWSYANAYGYRLDGQLSVGDLVAIDDTTHDVTYSGTATTAGQVCNLNPGRDAVIPVQATLTNASNSFSVGAAMSIGFASTAGTGDPTVDIAQIFSNSTECENASLGWNGGGWSVQWPDPVLAKSSANTRAYLVLHDYYTPQHPGGNTDWLRSLEADVMPADNDTTADKFTVVGASSLPLGIGLAGVPAVSTPSTSSNMYPVIAKDFLSVRATPAIGAVEVGRVSSGASVHIVCVTQGDAVVDHHGRTITRWDQIDYPFAGYVADAFVDTNNQRAPVADC